MRRVLLATGIAVVFAFGSTLVAHAQTGVCSDTHLAPGETITVNGSGAAPGETATLNFDGSAIGATTVDGFGNFSVSGQIPSSAMPGTYEITVTFTTSAPITPCTVTVESAAAATPTPTPPPPSPAPAAQAALPQPQQQQQQQQQQLIVPAFAHVPVEPRTVFVTRETLPKTGTEIADLAQGGFGSLIVGLSLLGFARRRKRAMAASPTRVTSEADLLLPFWPS